MKSFYTLLVLSVVGIIAALGVIFYDQRPTESQTKPIPELTPPYKNFIAGTGIVESGSKNIQMGSVISGVISKVNVKSGDSVKKGELLFTIDEKKPAFNIKALEAEIKLAEIKLQNAQHQFKIVQNIKKTSPLMLKEADYIAAKYKVKEAQAVLSVANSKLKVLQNELSLYAVYSPIDGKVLESKLGVGEYFSQTGKLLTLGSDTLRLRVNINEYDLYKYAQNTNAVAFVRGHPEFKIPLKYLYTMPYVVPKKNLTGLATERTDTRVLQVLYSLPKRVNFPLFVGQQLDVFIQSKEK
jgi:multidrug efflux pump subunit AcrA (membrane-fusion protein)